MRKVANLSSAEREALFLVSAREKALPEVVIEKDFWVCWTSLQSQQTVGT